VAEGEKEMYELNEREREREDHLAKRKHLALAVML
jgi:hypothetical protein